VGRAKQLYELTQRLLKKVTKDFQEHLLGGKQLLKVNLKVGDNGKHQYTKTYGYIVAVYV
jgi:hypothetical protein